MSKQTGTRITVGETAMPVDPMEVCRDPHRVAALRRTGVLDTPPEEEFDRLTRLAAEILNVPVAIVNLVSENWQFFKSSVGLGEPLASERGMPVEHSFCKHAVASGEALVIPDTRRHPAHWDNPMISELGIIAYAGIPLVNSGGFALGTLCVIDAKPRAWTARQIRILRDLAASVMTEIELRVALGENERLAEQEKVVALLKERERIAMDLHDGVIQSLYAVALGLRAQARTLGERSSELSTSLDQAIGQIDSVIQQIRNYIFDLRPHEAVQYRLRRGIEILADELRVNALLDPHLDLSVEAEELISPEASSNILAIAREATSNVIRHAQASVVTIRLTAVDGKTRLVIQDNGHGFEQDQASALDGNGLRNMATRAQAIGGRLVVNSQPLGGTEVCLELPLQLATGT